VVTGDVTQIDLQRGQKSGLIDAVNILKDVRGIAFTRFNSSDVVRHPLVARIVDAYETALQAAPVASTHGVIEAATPPAAPAKPVQTGITKTARSRHAAKK
jgi:phosphate starvation-inducible PhoH-like protein